MKSATVKFVAVKKAREEAMPSQDRIKVFDRQRVTARRYRILHEGMPGRRRVIAAAAIEARAGHRILRETLGMALPG